MERLCDVTGASRFNVFGIISEPLSLSCGTLNFLFVGVFLYLFLGLVVDFPCLFLELQDTHNCVAMLQRVCTFKFP